MSDPRKTAIIAALRKFVRQRPGLEFGNYGDVRAYRAELYQIGKDKRDAETLLYAVESRDTISADDLIKAAESAYSGRLTIKTAATGSTWIDGEPQAAWRADISYCVGQYMPTEYRKAVAAVCARALWKYVREHCMPKPCNKDPRDPPRYADYASKTVVSAGEWLRAHFRREFGRSIANRWLS